MRLHDAVLFLGFLIALSGCSSNATHEELPLFEKINAVSAGIDFVNTLEYTEEFNVYTFRNFYNGAGVGIGDFNNDGLPDLFFCGNQVDNKLYLNKGDFQFLDITETAGVASKNVWTTGVSVVDINGDGWLDIYVCKSGDLSGANRHNELFINQGLIDSAADQGLVYFSEESEAYGLGDVGLSTHATFFDYDLDGDLDCYLLNNSFRSIGNYDLRPDQRSVRDTLGGNKLFRNNGTTNSGRESNRIFEDVSQSAGIYGSSIGFGLGVTFGDINQDGWPDIYVSNDFFEKDYLYINNQNGTFSESVDEYIGELSMGSMGADIADINNDGMQDIFVTEMLPRSEERQKTKSIFENWNKYQAGVSTGYHKQFARNVLQLNTGQGAFKEIGRFANVAATDWSWGALIFDMDNDGWKDLFVANGIYKDLLDQDYINFYSNPEEVKRILFDKEKGGLDKLVDLIPSEALSNFAFKNRKNLTFVDESVSWGFEDRTFSNGSAYGDLDNDGDLDLVVNNVNAPPLIYKNKSSTHVNGYLQLTLVDSLSNNRYGVGSTVTLFQKGGRQLVEVNPARGFMSTVDSRIHFGLDNRADIDSIIVKWPDQTKTKLYSVRSAQHLRIIKTKTKDSGQKTKRKQVETILQVSSTNVPYKHLENNYSDFDREALLIQMHSNLGPACCTGDINNDGLTDFFIGGAKGQIGQLFVQRNDGGYRTIEIPELAKSQASEDVDCIFYDANGDQSLDLYVASGSSEYGPNNGALIDRLYMNNGDGSFSLSNQVLPTFNFENSSSVANIDFDKDGDNDLLVGTFIRSFNYGMPSNVYLLQNDGLGNYENVTTSISGEMLDLGMVTDIEVADLEGDGDQDIIVIGEWMAIKIFLNDNGQFSLANNDQLEELTGLWNTLFVEDLDGDGDVDIVVGNHGLNSRLSANANYPMHLYVNDFDKNGRIEQIITYTNDRGEYPLAQRGDIIRQLPYLAKKYPDYKSYANQRVGDIFSEEQLKRSRTLEIKELRSVVLWNDGSGNYDVKPLPREAQLSPIYAIYADDINGDRFVDLLVGGNQSKMKPEIGINMASYGLLLLGEEAHNFKAVKEGESGIFEIGEIRKIVGIHTNSETDFLFAKNNGLPVIYEKKHRDE